MEEKQDITEEEVVERDELVDELVSKGGPTTGQIKVNQDPEKVARLLELGWKGPPSEADKPMENKDAAEVLTGVPTEPPIELEVVAIYRTDGKKILILQTLYKRAKEKAGMSDEMMATYPDIKSLKSACDRIHPASNPDAYPQEGEAPKPVEYEDNMPDKFDFDSAMEAKFVSQNRAQFDETNLQAELRRLNRKYGAHEPVKIVATKTFKQVKGMNKDRVACKVLITHFEIYMK